MKRSSVIAGVLAVLMGAAAPAGAHPGGLDPTFGTAGSIEIGATPAYVDGASNGGALYAGVQSGAQGGDQLVTARTMPDGTSDTSYGLGGSFAASLTSTQNLAGVSFTGDGGVRALFDDTASADFAVFAVTDNGEADTTYGSAGVAHPDPSASHSWTSLDSPQIDSDGALTIAGELTTDLGGGNSDTEPALARITAAGKLDATFGVGGILDLPAAAGDGVPSAIGVRFDSGVVTASADSSAGTIVVAAFTATGVLDPSFNGGQPLSVSLPDALSGATPASVGFNHSGQIFIVLDAGQAAVLGVNPNGTVDTAYGSQGFATGPSFGGLTAATAGLVDTAGRVVATGAGTDGVMATRFTTSGAVDTGFGDDGLAAASSPSGGGGVASTGSIAEDGSGRLLVVGADLSNPYFSEPQPFIARFRCDTNLPPTATFTFTPSNPRAGQVITLHSTATDPDGHVVDEFWDLNNDGKYDDADGPDATLRLTASGTATVGLKVYDDDGASTTSHQQITVAPNSPPVASFATHPTIPGAGTTTFDAGASTDDGDIVSYQWTFDDGQSTQTVTSDTPTIEQDLSYGTTSVTLQVTDDVGAVSDPVTHTYVVQDTPPTAQITASPGLTVNRGETVTLSAEGSTDADGPIAAYAWDTDGDGAYDDDVGDTISLSFNTLGDHLVGLRVIDSAGQTGTADVTVSVVNAPPTVGAIGGAADGFTYDSHTLSVSASDPDSADAPQVQWSVDGGAHFDAATGTPVTLTFTSPGVTTVEARAADADGGTATTNPVTIQTANRPPVADVVVTPTEPGADETLTANASPSYDPDGTIVSYAWDLNNDGVFDVAPSSNPTQDVTPGQTFRVRVTDNDGASTDATATAPSEPSSQAREAHATRASALCRAPRVVLRAAAAARTVRLRGLPALHRGTRVALRSLRGVLLAIGRAGAALRRVPHRPVTRDQLALARLQVTRGDQTCGLALPVRIG